MGRKRKCENRNQGLGYWKDRASEKGSKLGLLGINKGVDKITYFEFQRKAPEHRGAFRFCWVSIRIIRQMFDKYPENSFAYKPIVQFDSG